MWFLRPTETPSKVYPPTPWTVESDVHGGSGCTSTCASGMRKRESTRLRLMSEHAYAAVPCVYTQNTRLRMTWVRFLDLEADGDAR